MLLGSFEGRVDGQGRIVVPLRFRGEYQLGMILAGGVDGCIAVYSPVAWQAEAERAEGLSRLNRNARTLRRLTFSMAFEATADRQGRVVIPPKLREFSGISDEVVIAGQNTYFEIWAADRWAEQEAQGPNLADIAEGLEMAHEPSR